MTERNIEYTPDQKAHVTHTFDKFVEAARDYMGTLDAKALRRAFRAENEQRSSKTLARVLLIRAAVEASIPGGTQIKDLWNLTSGQQTAAIIGAHLFNKSGSMFADLHTAAKLAVSMHEVAHNKYIEAHTTTNQG